MSLLAQTYKFTIDEFLRLHEAGVLQSDDRIELLEGELIIMHAQGYRHGQLVTNLNAEFSEQARRRYMVALGLPIELNVHSSPEPDLALIPYAFQRPSKRNPSAAEVYLAIEVSDTSLVYDRGPKKRAYAEAGIPEYWIFDLQHDRVEVYRQPIGPDFQESFEVPFDGTLAPLRFPDVAISLAQVVPAR